MDAEFQQIILATNGSAQCRKAEKYAVTLSNKQQQALHIIHVTDTRMARYGIIEPLAPEICSKQFSKYITSQANQTLNKVLNRVKKIEAMADVSICFHNLQGDPAQAIQKFILQQSGKTILVIGKRANKQGFFNVKSDLAKRLSRKYAGQEIQVSEI